jgi:transposase IS66 family protein
MTQEEEIAQLNKQLQEVLQRLSEAEQRERLLRDGHDLQEQYPGDAAVQYWFSQLKALYKLAYYYMGTSTPLHTLCERVQRFLPELFVFVARPEAPAHNNLDERSMRPLVIARKISGGSRSPKGSETNYSLPLCADGAHT